MERYVLLTFAKTTTMTTTFDLWMPRKGFDTFMLVVNYTNQWWETCHIIVGIFEVHETLGVAMTI